MMTGRGEETRFDQELLRDRLPPSWDFIYDLDVAKHRDEALAKLEHALSKR